MAYYMMAGLADGLVFYEILQLCKVQRRTVMIFICVFIQVRALFVYVVIYASSLSPGTLGYIYIYIYVCVCGVCVCVCVSVVCVCCNGCVCGVCVLMDVSVVCVCCNGCVCGMCVLKDVSVVCVLYRM